MVRDVEVDGGRNASAVGWRRAGAAAGDFTRDIKPKQNQHANGSKGVSGRYQKEKHSGNQQQLIVWQVGNVIQKSVRRKQRT